MAALDEDRGELCAGLARCLEPDAVALDDRRGLRHPVEPGGHRGLDIRRARPLGQVGGEQHLEPRLAIARRRRVRVGARGRDGDAQGVGKRLQCLEPERVPPLVDQHDGHQRLAGRYIDLDGVARQRALRGRGGPGRRFGIGGIGGIVLDRCLADARQAVRGDAPGAVAGQRAAALGLDAARGRVGLRRAFIGGYGGNAVVGGRRVIRLRVRGLCLCLCLCLCLLRTGGGLRVVGRGQPGPALAGIGTRGLGRIGRDRQPRLVLGLRGSRGLRAGQHGAVALDRDAARRGRVGRRRGKRRRVPRGRCRGGIRPAQALRVIGYGLRHARGIGRRGAVAHLGQRRLAILAHRIEARARRHLDSVCVGGTLAQGRHVGEIDHNRRGPQQETRHDQARHHSRQYTAHCCPHPLSLVPAGPRFRPSAP